MFPPRYLSRSSYLRVFSFFVRPTQPGARAGAGAGARAGAGAGAGAGARGGAGGRGRGRWPILATMSTGDSCKVSCAGWWLHLLNVVDFLFGVAILLLAVLVLCRWHLVAAVCVPSPAPIFSGSDCRAQTGTYGCPCCWSAACYSSRQRPVPARSRSGCARTNAPAAACSSPTFSRLS